MSDVDSALIRKIRVTASDPFMDIPVLTAQKVRRAIQKKINCGDIRWDDQAGSWVLLSDGSQFIGKGVMGTVYLLCIRLGLTNLCNYVVKLQTIVDHQMFAVILLENAYQNIVHNKLQAHCDLGFDAPIVPAVYEGYDAVLATRCDNVIDMDGEPANASVALTVMDKAKGLNLAKILKHSKEHIAMAIQSIDALIRNVDILHKLGLQHGDLNPANIFYDTATDNITLIDLSIPVEVTLHEDDDHRCIDRPDYYDYVTLLYYIGHYSKDKRIDTDVLEHMFVSIMRKIQEASEDGKPNTEIFIKAYDGYKLATQTNKKPKLSLFTEILRYQIKQSFSHLFYPYSELCHDNSYDDTSSLVRTEGAMAET